ncbi:unnamed protein product [Miscanthus lutarioriparius]|uniref:Protein kinase domain-containing protein n=1 Tax=Miscanthus lutarioriparius TaxID=422564 RepID=A0A811QAW1_9POAL|nr:unnamed protein product [Miscanthus lutarioriparius]
MSDQQASEVEDLERIFADASKDPIQISYGVIKSITKNFAQVIGNGAFGVVYLGALKNGLVAVKKLSQSTNDLSDTQFLDEVKCLKRVKHQNIVRFLGYCVESHGEVIEIDGKQVIAEWHETLNTDCQQMKRCIEVAKNCVESEPYKRPTIADIVHKLNEIETTIQKVPQVVNEPRNDPSSSLHQVVKRFKALSVQTLHEYSRFADIYEDLNVLEHIVEGSENPSNLSYPLLQFITENFSDKRKIGHNELGECFKGIVQIVVVTRLSGSLNINDGVFHQQIGNMMMARHQNVVQFLGYCSYAVEKKVEIGGDVVIAEKRERLLCFEYLSKGNLSNHLSVDTQLQRGCLMA